VFGSSFGRLGEDTRGEESPPVLRHSFRAVDATGGAMAALLAAGPGVGATAAACCSPGGAGCCFLTIGISSNITA